MTPVLQFSLESFGKLDVRWMVGAVGNLVRADAQVWDGRAHRGKEPGQGRGSVPDAIAGITEGGHLALCHGTIPI